MPDGPLKSPFVPLPTKIDLGGMDRAVIEWWQANNVFNRSLEQTADGPPWVFYEGPPTANGTPGTHHIEARVFKDLFPRYRTMRGFSVPRRAGWDCHGLPVELAVEKELGLSGKPDIEKMGVAEFNALCRTSVLRHVDEFVQLSERMGYWIDLEHPYQTMSPEYVDSVWWSLKQIHDGGRLVEDFRVAPYCTRDGTTLSDHEVAQGYETVTDPSVYVRFPLRGDVAGHGGVDLLVWTTTPWTLVSNTAVAVHPAVTYAVARTGQGTFVVAEPLTQRVLGDDAEILATVPGSALEGLRYERPFDLVDIPDAHQVVLAEYVTTEDGTGLVHQAPAFGADDLAVCRAYGLPLVNPVAPNGRFNDGIDLVGGVFFKDADALLIDRLKKSGRLFRHEPFEHPYPHCWRCHTPLMYYAQPSWYIRTTEVRDELTRENENTNWFPEHIKHGRYGDWLKNNIDWAVSRARYWGTPLPLWRCPDNHVTAVGSRTELGDLAGADLSELDPHRPYVDEITFACPDCGQIATRVPEVIDAWYDSGAMPFASLGYPHVPGSKEIFERTYPAQYICEAIDQTRGWFYTLMAVGTLVFDRSPYENVVCLGHILAEDGRKMSKHLGNILLPIPLMDTHGADAVRWFMACSGSPWSPRRIGPGPLDEIVRKVLMTYWNTAAFFSLYAANSTWAPHLAQPVAQRPVLDRWIVGELHALAAAVDERMQNYDTARAGRLLADFIDDLSNWYVRRSRQRFWEGDPDALTTLYECLDILTRLLAPFIPFVTEEVWQQLVRRGAESAPESVHLATWPTPDTTLISTELSAQVATARALAEAGRSARKASSLRIRQPLSRALVGLPAGTVLPQALLDDIGDELNVKVLQPLDPQSGIIDVQVKANFRTLGRRFGNRTQHVAKAIAAVAPRDLVDGVRANGTYPLSVDGAQVEVGLDDILITEVPRTGWVVESQRGATIALDTEITPELAAEGVARDVVRIIQQARRDADFEVSDRITVSIAAPADVAAAISTHQKLIAHETLALQLTVVDALSEGFSGTVGDGQEIVVHVVRA
ncbi:Isoleucine--tRNA ligase [Micromonospora saelicesensis]|uniref:Isoleucine--tRNA ligase n=1 Tax=Micromonospora saelicesensis TaxID=285676 RepID=A0ABX9CAS3_9ACTN|nr:isoleucine--tRNA ligase [Micromonospora saelicesensis]RAN93065.1 Isoleucine--tRNA ligase [Micromonospora saelicesensis]